MLKFNISILACLLFFGCSQGGKPKARFDAGSEKVLPAAKGIAELAGQWTGSAVTSEFGVVVGSLSLQANGQGRYFVSAKSVNRQGAFEVLLWDGALLRVRSEKANRDLQATRTGRKLIIVIPELNGTVTLTR